MIRGTWDEFIVRDIHKDNENGGISWGAIMKAMFCTVYHDDKQYIFYDHSSKTTNLRTFHKFEGKFEVIRYYNVKKAFGSDSIEMKSWKLTYICRVIHV